MIDVEGVSARSDDSIALREASFAAAGGELVCVTGPNADGTTTLLRMLAGLIKPTVGRVRVAGYAATDREAQNNCGFAPEVPDLCDFLTVREQLSFACGIRGFYLQPIARELRANALADYHDVLVRDLAQPMRKQLGLLAATMHDPPLVLLDEPTTALDALAVSDLRATLREWQARRKTVIVGTRDAAWVEDLANRLVTVDEGRITRKSTKISSSRFSHSDRDGNGAPGRIFNPNGSQ
ncbi:ATP-binding cassette domain-containing protein [Streptomyces vinaceus]